jgi:hypothetical protein
MRKQTTLTAAILALTALAFAGAANAQVNTEPPGVARISFIRGDVSMQRGDSGDTSAVELNTPLVAGDKVFTGPNSRVEIQLDWANMIRLDQNAEVDIATLDQTRIQVQLAQGLASFSVLKGYETGAEIDTPNVSVNPHRDGRYRIEVTPAGDTLVTVRDGEADVSTPEGSTLVKDGQLITVRGTGNDVQFQVTRAPFTDDFDRWNSDRDRIVQNAESYRRTNRYYTGVSDLDAYGRWDNIPDYGDVWVPRVAVGWAPYRHGRWVWTAYWGWTWTADEPWGWAPYHYGRWFVHGASWVWWPGPVTPIYRPIYAPAYVSFFGFGSHSGVSVGVGFGGGFGSIGWLPAGPCDFVSPWWGPHRNNFNVVNITNINVYNVRNGNVIAPLRGGERDSNMHNMLINNQVRYGLSTVSSDNFGRGRANVRTVTTDELRDGRFMTGNVPVVPSRESLRTSERTVVAGASRPSGQERQFFSRRAPSTQRESFSDESARLQQTFGRDQRPAQPNDGAAGRAAANTGPASRSPDNRPAGNPGGFGNRNGNGAEVSSPRQAPQAQQSQTPQAARPQTPAADARGDSNGGWRRFGGGQAAPPASGDSQGSQREPVLRAPRQRGTTSESSPNRLELQGSQPGPAQNENRSTEPQAQSGFSRFSAQGGAGNQPSGNQAQPNTDNRPSGWQRFSGAPRPSSPAGGGGTGAARTDGRPQIQLNRPIIQPRDSGNRGFAESPRGASRESAPGGSERVAPAPRSAPSAPAPSSGGNRMVPQGGGGGSRSEGGSSGGRSPSSSNSRGRAQSHR